jgi:thymidylate kinase
MDVLEESVNPEERETLGALAGCQEGALSALSASSVPFLLLRLPVPATERARELDLLIAAGGLPEAARVLAGAGFLPKASPLGLPSKVVFSSFDGERFYSLDVHTSVVSRGLVYLDAGSILERRVRRQGLFVPSHEDSLLHLVLHPLLSRREIGGKYEERIRRLAALDLDREYLGRHLDRFGLRSVFDETLSALLNGRPADAEAIFGRARRALLRRVPGNLVRRVRYRLARMTPVRRRNGLVAFLGVDGVGKSSLVAELQGFLEQNGLRTTSVYMGCWGRYQTRARWVRSYSPRDGTEGEGRGGAVTRRLKNLAKAFLFYGGILYEQMVRYRRGVLRSRAHLVLSDRYFYDLEIPFSRRYVAAGRWARRVLYRSFPAPDLVFHLWSAPDEIRSRKDELEERQIVHFEQIYTRVLARRPVVRLRVDARPPELVRRLVARHWRDLLNACWRHSPRNVLR